MSGKRAAILLVIVSVVVAILLLMQSIPPVAGALAFAAALAIAGLLSGGFRK
jgi:hypothetical protein